MHFMIFTYANLDGDKLDGKGKFGFAIYLVPNLICWYVRKQVIVARSSIDVNYTSLATTFVEFIWLQYLLRELR